MNMMAQPHSWEHHIRLAEAPREQRESHTTRFPFSITYLVCISIAKDEKNSIWILETRTQKQKGKDGEFRVCGMEGWKVGRNRNHDCAHTHTCVNGAVGEEVGTSASCRRSFCCCFAFSHSFSFTRAHIHIMQVNKIEF